MNVNKTIISNNVIDSSRAIKVNGNDRKRTGRCALCGAIAKDVTVPVFGQPRGVKLCRQHSGDNIFYNLQSYATEQKKYGGKVTSKHISQSIELESVKNTDVSIANMITQYEFIPTRDGSLYPKGIEWKSKIYVSNQGATKALGGVEWLNNNNYFTTLDNTVGCHLHTGIVNDDLSDRYDFRHIFKNVDEYFSVFGLVYKYLENMSNADMKKYFGRGFVNYARTIRKENNMYVLPCHDGNGKRISNDNAYLSTNADLYGTQSFDCSQHLLAFNLQHPYSIEFRLPKFVNAKQYRNVMLAMQDTTLALQKYWIDTPKTEENATTASVEILKAFSAYFNPLD